MHQHALQFIEISLLKRHITLDFCQCISVSIMTTCGYVSCVRPGLSLAAACCILSTVLQKPWASLGQEDCLLGKQHRNEEILKRNLGSQPACNKCHKNEHNDPEYYLERSLAIHSPPLLFFTSSDLQRPN